MKLKPKIYNLHFQSTMNNQILVVDNTGKGRENVQSVKKSIRKSSLNSFTFHILKSFYSERKTTKRTLHEKENSYTPTLSIPFVPTLHKFLTHHATYYSPSCGTSYTCNFFAYSSALMLLRVFIYAVY